MQQITGTRSEVLVAYPSTAAALRCHESFRLHNHFPSISFLPPSLSKRCPSFGPSKLASGMDKCRPRSLTVRASGDPNKNVVPVSPLEFESPVGQLLAQILQTHPHLLLAAIDQQLEKLQSDKESQKEVTPPSEDVLYKLVLLFSDPIHILFMGLMDTV
uniref:Uncharacterized protein n=1 Tax=Rhizophora mucronata TaxID=61149 RepID=A0A2P2IQF4_RHIMU